MKIIEYDKKYQKEFIALNIAWIEKYFVPEQEDYDILNNVDELLRSGAMIYFAVEGEQVLATCMAMPLHDNVWELCKLAANTHFQGHGAGTAVFKACMDYAAAHGAEQIMLISNSILKPALHIYQKLGFQPAELPPHTYDRADVAFRYTVPGK